MAQDGIGYFACNLVITTANLVVLKRVTPDLRDFLFVVQGAIQSILCSRLLFHIYEVNEAAAAPYVVQVSSSRTVIEMKVRSQQELQHGSVGSQKV